MDPTPEPRPARVEERAAALRLLFRQHPPSEANRLIANALWLIDKGEVDADGLQVFCDPSGLLASLLCLPLPGASGLVWVPRSAPGKAAPERDDLLLAHGLDWLRGKGVKLAQALLAPEDIGDVATLERHGFRHITHLWYLRHEPGASLLTPADPPRLTYEPFDQVDPAIFRQTLLRTYVDTLDCPEVNGARTAEEVLEGHQAQGQFDPERWWLLRDGAEPIGVLLVIEQTDCPDWEVSYLGLVPEARRRGFGREAMRRVLALAGDTERRVGLSVDGRNRPAWELYRGLGFEPHERREICLAVWR
jgi:ribosomal protein S18 acetylase RimI-like enzyme